MNLKDESWKDFFTQGVRYMNTAEKSVKCPEVFTPEVIFNISSMAIEKILMAVFMSEGELPYGHTLADLAEYAKGLIGLDEVLVEDMNRMNSMQMICDGFDVHCEKMKSEDIPFFLDVTRRVFATAEEFLRPQE